MAYDFHHDVGAAAARGSFDLRDGVVVEVDGNGTDAFRFLEALGHGVDDVDFVDESEGGGDGTIPTGPQPTQTTVNSLRSRSERFLR